MIESYERGTGMTPELDRLMHDTLVQQYEADHPTDNSDSD
jgi:hypothetical protein